MQAQHVQPVIHEDLHRVTPHVIEMKSINGHISPKLAWLKDVENIVPSPLHERVARVNELLQDGESPLRVLMMDLPVCHCEVSGVVCTGCIERG